MAEVKKVIVMASNAKTFFDENDQLAESLAEMYCQVWKEPPWNEDSWNVDEVKVELIQLNCKYSSIGCYAIHESEKCKAIVGFALGYQISKEEMGNISSGRELDYLFGNKIVFYIDELAVCREFRQQGIASTLCKNLIDNAIDSGSQLIVLRTDKDAVAARKVYERQGFRDIGIKDGKYSTRTYLIKEVEK